MAGDVGSSIVSTKVAGTDLSCLSEKSRRCKMEGYPNTATQLICGAEYNDAVCQVPDCQEETFEDLGFCIPHQLEGQAQALEDRRHPDDNS